MTRKEIVFVVLSLVLAWLVALPLWLSQSRPTWLIQVTALGMMPMPTLAAIITHRIYHSDKPFIDVTALRGGKPLTVLRWCCVASFSVVIQLIATIMVGALSGAGNFSFSDAALGCLMSQVSLRRWIPQRCRPHGCCSSSHWSAVLSEDFRSMQ